MSRRCCRLEMAATDDPMAFLEEYAPGKTVASFVGTPYFQRFSFRLLYELLMQIVRDGFFHADAHTGNILKSADGEYLIDVGAFGRLAPNQRRLALEILYSLTMGNTSSFLKNLQMFGASVSPTQVQALESVVGQKSTNDERFRRVFEILSEDEGSLPESLFMLFQAISKIGIYLDSLTRWSSLRLLLTVQFLRLSGVNDQPRQDIVADVTNAVVNGQRDSVQRAIVELTRSDDQDLGKLTDVFQPRVRAQFANILQSSPNQVKQFGERLAVSLKKRSKDTRLNKEQTVRTLESLAMLGVSENESAQQLQTIQLKNGKLTLIVRSEDDLLNAQRLVERWAERKGDITILFVEEMNKAVEARTGAWRTNHPEAVFTALPLVQGHGLEGSSLVLTQIDTLLRTAGQTAGLAENDHLLVLPNGMTWDATGLSEQVLRRLAIAYLTKESLRILPGQMLINLDKVVRMVATAA